MKAKVIQVIQVTNSEGNGSARNPVRDVIYYYNLEGVLLAKNDPTMEDKEHGE